MNSSVETGSGSGQEITPLVRYDLDGRVISPYLPDASVLLQEGPVPLPDVPDHLISDASDLD